MSTETSLQFNKIIIIQSIREEDKEKGIIKDDDNGIELEKTIRYACMKMKYPEQNFGQLENVESRIEFFGLLDDLLDAVKNNNLKPFLHFEMHGFPEGLQLKNMEIVLWTEIRDHIRDINTHCKNSLFVTFATCFGAYFINLYEMMEPCPFYGYVGATKTVFEKDVLVSYTNFFETLITTSSIPKAIKSLLESVEINKDIFTYITCHLYYDKLLELNKEMYGTQEAKEKELNDITNKLMLKEDLANAPRDRVRYMVEVLVSEFHEKTFVLWRKIFLHEVPPDVERPKLFNSKVNWNDFQKK